MKQRFALFVVLALSLAPAAPLFAKGAGDKPHTFTVVLHRGKIEKVTSNPADPDNPFPVFKRGRGDRILFLTRDNRYWIRFRTPTPLRLKGEPAQVFEVYMSHDRPTPIYTFTTDAPPDGADWERFPFEIHAAQDMPREEPGAERELHTGDRPKPPSLKELQKQKHPIDLLIDAVK